MAKMKLKDVDVLALLDALNAEADRLRIPPGQTNREDIAAKRAAAQVLRSLASALADVHLTWEERDREAAERRKPKGET